MTPQELKNSILQLAIQGKLVEQRPEEGTAEELYQQIQVEKQQLINEGKIKKEKSLSEITEDEIQFDIPESWKWVRLGDIYRITMGQSPDGESISESTYGLEFHQGKMFFGEDYLQKSNQVTDKPTKIAEPNSVLLCVRAPVGIVNITEREICIGRGLCAISTYANMDAKYVLYSLRSCKADFIKKATGTTFAAITGEVVKNQIIPLPPLAEQNRIVAKIEELLQYIARYEKAWNKLEELNKRFPIDLQKSILQMAIQGKLVEQRPEEGTGEELYQQIQDEKQRLIKEGKIKKEKPLLEITEDEIPFDIPENWKWVRISDVVDVRDGTHDTPDYVPHGYPLITGKDFYTGSFDLSKTQYISKQDYEKICQRSKVDIGDILFSMIGGNIGSMICITKANYFEMAIKNVALFKQYSSEYSITEYLYIFLKSQISNMQAIAKGGAQSFVSLKLLRNYLMPLPPLSEQKRIIAKLEEILLLCEKLKNT